MEWFLSRHHIEELLDNIGEGVQIIDRKGKIIYCNEAAAKLDNVNREEAIGRNILEVYPSLTEETSTLLQVMATGRPILNLQQTFVNFRGYRITTINSSLPVMEGKKILGAIEISRDITAVRALSERVLDLQKQLYKDETKRNKDTKGTAKYTFMDIIGQSKEILKLKSKALKAAESLSSIMVYGNTGSGKELVVQSIHNASNRRNKPFIAQNCAAIPPTLLESILFGTVKGTFTGADHRPGLFELANGGTLFLDEINSMPIELQAKLLRVLEESSIRRVGDIRTREVDVRIIAAMNINPMEALENRLIRSDLFYRLNVVSLRVPDLKERKEDIPLLVDYFVRQFNEKLDKTVIGVEDNVLKTFISYPWPGNVRELKHVIEGAMNVLEGNYIKDGDLPQHLQRTLETIEDSTGFSLREVLIEAERKAIASAIKEAEGNVTNAAKALQIPRQTLQYKMKKLKIK
ncbi:sigma-54 interaction domain-containing protein [Alkaliphilus serpentinus]|uniref:PAS domain-containing protein n=1 Tax=Alkaliphilus serpentinus TaxID=1482731 RepID=A0A833HR19_9FIRM|nr:sigma 54-interacting transcriptional regulator [Alkaliphilus serpentinus]KAB3532461.1 PAS domain-containing protein [Alkaliphilus serpentinus]